MRAGGNCSTCAVALHPGLRAGALCRDQAHGQAGSVMTRRGHLHGITLLSDLSAQTRSDLAQRCLWRAYAAEDVIFAPNAGRPDAVLFIVEGQVRLGLAEESGTIRFEDLGPGDQLGALEALGAPCRSVSLQALSDCLIARLDPQAWQACLSENGALAVSLLRSALRSSTAETVFAGLRPHQDYTPVYRVLLDMAGAVEEGPAAIERLPKHQILAARAGTSPETVAAALAALIRDGLARRAYRGLEIFDAGALRARAEAAA